MRLWTVLLLMVLLGTTAHAKPVKTEYSQAELLVSQASVNAGDSFYFALELTLRDHWHSYWLNPGDAGLATEITWELPKGIKAGNIMWPTPKTIPLGQLLNYGYEGTTLYPVPFTVGSDFSAEGPIEIKAHATWLVCEIICVPDQARFSVFLNSPKTKPANKKINKALAQLPAMPEEQSLQAGFTATTEQIKFHFAGELARQINRLGSDVYFFPENTGAVKHSAPQRRSAGENGFTLWTEPGFRAKRGTLQNLDGLLVAGSGKSAKAWQVTSLAGVIPAGIAADTPPEESISSKSGQLQTSESEGGFWNAILFAFIGGMILNLMPCVFPVLSLKIMGFVNAANEKQAAHRETGLLFGVGVLLSFLALAGLLLVLKAGGEQIGWGFQLQSGWFVAALATLFYVMGLNLLGVFTIGTRIMGIGGTLAEGNSKPAAFFTGVLAVLVASPCTAPAMGSALGYTLTQSPLVTLLVFAALGAGFAAPFMLLSFYPGWLRVLPRPGPWMQRFHQFMAFPMFAAAIWLLWVLGGLQGMIAIGSLLGVFLMTGFAIWAAKGGKFGKALALGGVLAAVWLFQNAIADRDVTELTPIAWSAEKVTEFQQEGRYIFVDFTAEWCLTCQFNKKTTLASKKIRDAFASKNVAFLVADWTRRDALITTELARHGRAGVPMYLVYQPDSPTPLVLPEILTEKMVLQAINP